MRAGFASSAGKKACRRNFCSRLENKMEQYSTRFIVGMVLLTTNQFVGWGGIALCAYLAKKTCKKVYALWGTIIYALSWGMLFLGAWLAGPEGLRIAKKYAAKFGWWSVAAAA